MRSDEVIIRELIVREDPNLRRTWSPLCCVLCVCVTRVANIGKSIFLLQRSRSCKCESFDCRGGDVPGYAAIASPSCKRALISGTVVLLEVA
jgi:hypothetical protein